MKISIIIPNFNGRTLLENNLPKIISAAESFEKANWEIIIVDDASTDGSARFLKKNYPRIKLIVHKTTQYFAKSCNDGVKSAKGEIVVLLNNDVIPEKSFLKPLIKNFSDRMVFSVGCKEKGFANGKNIFSGRSGGDFKKGFLVHWRAEDQDQKETLWSASGSAAYRRDLWLKLGGLDSLFRPAYGEDLDLSYRALKSGFKVLFEPESQVFHQHETTNLKVFGKEKIKIYSFKNQFLFVWKNITDFSLLFSHFLWLFYHFFITTYKTKGAFLLGFFLALKQLPEALSARKKAKSYFVLNDREILEKFKDIQSYD